VSLPYPELNDGDNRCALFIKFRGRDWIIISEGEGDFLAIPANNQQAKLKEAENVMNYIIKEGFIDGKEPQMSA